MSKNTTPYAKTLDNEALGTFIQSDEYLSFVSQFGHKIRDLVDFVKENHSRFGCTIIVGAIPVSGRDGYKELSAGAGRTRELQCALKCLLHNSEIGKILTEAAIDKIIND